MNTGPAKPPSRYHSNAVTTDHTVHVSVSTSKETNQHSATVSVQGQNIPTSGDNQGNQNNSHSVVTHNSSLTHNNQVPGSYPTTTSANVTPSTTNQFQFTSTNSAEFSISPNVGQTVVTYSAPSNMSNYHNQYSPDLDNIDYYGYHAPPPHHHHGPPARQHHNNHHPMYHHGNHHYHGNGGYGNHQVGTIVF
jgi:hypothetical protein